MSTLLYVCPDEKEEPLRAWRPPSQQQFRAHNTGDGCARRSAPDVRYVAVPHALDELGLDPKDRAVVVALLSLAHRPYDRLLGGHDLIVEVRLAELARRSSVCERTLSGLVADLEERGLITRQPDPRRGLRRWTISPLVYGLPQDALERRRLAKTGSARPKRVYTAYPAHLLGTLDPAAATVLGVLLKALGAGVYERVAAGELLWVEMSVAELAARARVPERTTKRGLARLRELGYVESRARGRAGAVHVIVSTVYGASLAMSAARTGPPVPELGQNRAESADEVRTPP